MIFVNGYKYEPKFFPDGTLNMTEVVIMSERNAEYVDITWLFDNLIEQVIVQNLTCFIKDKYCYPVRLFLPYVPNARMDRVKDPKKEVHTLKYFCQFINSLGFATVFVRDVHSPVTMTLLDRAIEEDISHNISKVLTFTGAKTLFFPDKGSRDRYSYLPAVSQIIYAEKVRDWNTGKIQGVEIHTPPSPDYTSPLLIVDDISSFGGTFHYAANAAKEAGFTGNIYLYITHCENSILKGELINNPNVTHIYTTGSIFRGEHEKITVI